MKFTKVPVSDAKYLNYVFIEAKAGGIPVTAMFDTKGNTLIKESIAEQIDIDYIDEKPIDDKKGWRRARIRLNLGELEIGSAPVVVTKDENFDLIKDPQGNAFPADMILGWNIISQLCFRGNLKIGDFQVQVDDFKDPKAKDKPNSPVLYVDFMGERVLAALDTSKPVTSISQNIFDKITGKDGRRETMEMLGLDKEKLTYETALTIKIDEDTITLPQAQVNSALNDGKIEIIMGADLLWNTTWAIYSPMRYIRARQS